MKKFLAALAFVLLAGHVLAQTPETKALVNAYVNTNINTNGVGGITGATLNTALKKIITTMCGLAVAQDCVLPAGASNSNFPGLTGEVTSPVGNPVTTITNGAVINSKIGAGAVTSDKLAVGAAAANLGAGSVTNTMLQHSSITIDGQTCALGGTCTTPVYSVTDSRFGTSSCLGAPCPIGTGGDDSVPLNAISTACQAAGSCTVVFPPGVQLNVCSSSWNLPNVAPISMVIEGNGKSQGGVRVLPGCGTPPRTVINIPGGTLPGPPTVPSGQHYAFEHLRIDGYCLANHDLVVSYSANGNFTGVTAHDSMFRNVVPSLAAASIDGGSNILIQNGYQHSFDQSNSVENENDIGHTCYGNYVAGSTAGIGAFPPYMVHTYSSDSHYGIQGPGASIAALATEYGGANRFTHAHPWGYPATNSLSQPYSYPQYDFAFKGLNILDTTIFDSGAVAGVRQQAVPGTNGVQSITAVSNPGSGGTPGIVTLTGVSGTGTKWTAIGTVGASGSLTSIPWITYEGNYSVNPNLTGETATATGGLTGVVVNLQMGAYQSKNGSLISGVYGCCGTVNGFSIGQNVTSLYITNSDMSQLSGCIVLDAAATFPAQFEGDAVVGCNGIPYNAPAITSSCTHQYDSAHHGINWIIGSFQVTGVCASTSTFLLDLSATNRPQTQGWSCSFNTPDVKESTFTFNSVTIYAINAVSGQYINYICHGF